MAAAAQGEIRVGNGNQVKDVYVCVPEDGNFYISFTASVNNVNNSVNNSV